MLRQIQTFLLRLWRALACPGGVHYIAGAPSLPPPLTPEEEKQLLARNAGGRRGGTGRPHHPQPAAGGLHRQKIRKQRRAQLEDMISIGTIGLIKAVNTFTPEQEHQAGHLCLAGASKTRS